MACVSCASCVTCVVSLCVCVLCVPPPFHLLQGSPKVPREGPREAQGGPRGGEQVTFSLSICLRWFSAMSYVFLLALFFDLRTKRTATSSLCLTAFLCVVARTCKAIRTRFHGIVLFVASCYFLSSSAAFANLESNRHTQIALVFCIFPLFLPPPSSSFLLDTELQCKRAHSQRPRQRTPP